LFQRTIHRRRSQFLGRPWTGGKEWLREPGNCSSELGAQDIRRAPSSCSPLLAQLRCSEFWFDSWFAADDSGQNAGGLPAPVPRCSILRRRPATTRWGSTARRPEGTPPHSSIRCSPPISPVTAPATKMNSIAARPVVSVRRPCGLNHGGMPACALTAARAASTVWCAPTISRGLLRFLSEGCVFYDRFLWFWN